MASPIADKPRTSTRGARGFSAIRTNIFLTPVEDSALRELSRRTCMPVAEHVRRAVDEYLAKQNIQNQLQGS